MIIAIMGFLWQCPSPAPVRNFRVHLNMVTKVKPQTAQAAICRCHENMGVIQKGFHTSLIGTNS